MDQLCGHAGPGIQASVTMADCKKQACELAKQMLKYLPDINAPLRPTGESLLFLAVRHNYSDIVDLVLANGARVDVNDGAGFSTFEAVIQSHLLPPFVHYQPIPPCPDDGSCFRILHSLLHAGASVQSPHLLECETQIDWLHCVLVYFYEYHLPSGALERVIDGIIQAGLMHENVPEKSRYLILTDFEQTLEVAHGLTKKFIVAGFDLYSQRFVDEVQAQGEFAKPADREMVEFLLQERRSPPSLMRQCRKSIRRVLVEQGPSGVHLDRKVDGLPLPDVVKDCLKFRDGSLPKMGKQS